MLSGSHLLHHEQGKTDKSESVSEILKNDARRYYYSAGRLEISKYSIDHKRYIECQTIPYMFLSEELAKHSGKLARNVACRTLLAAILRPTRW